MSSSLYLVFVATELVLCLIPGPAVMLIISQALSSSARGCSRGILGILSANTLYFTISAFGLGALLVASSWLFTLVKWCGVVYLTLLALSMLFRSDKLGAQGEQITPSGQRHFLQGLLLQLSNPKAIIFFVALLPQFISTQANVALQFSLLGVTSILIEATILLAYGTAAATARHLIRNQRFVSIQHRVSGGLLLAAAVGLAATREFRK